MSRQEEVIEAFTELAPRYERVVDSEINRFWGWSYDRFVNRFIELTPLSNGNLVLDVATGTAAIPCRLVQNGKQALHVVGLDITAAMLMRAKEKIEKERASSHISLTCADALVMPFGSGSFDLVMCGLATHHMNVLQMLSEMKRVLKPGGRLAVADVAGSPFWHFPLVKLAIRAIAFVYFLTFENLPRTLAEVAAVSNVNSPADWQGILTKTGFKDISIVKLPSTRSWAPDPVVIEAMRP